MIVEWDICSVFSELCWLVLLVIDECFDYIVCIDLCGLLVDQLIFYWVCFEDVCDGSLSKFWFGYLCSVLSEVCNICFVWSGDICG